MVIVIFPLCLHFVCVPSYSKACKYREYFSTSCTWTAAEKMIECGGMNVDRGLKGTFHVQEDPSDCVSQSERWLFHFLHNHLVLLIHSFSCCSIFLTDFLRFHESWRRNGFLLDETDDCYPLNDELSLWYQDTIMIMCFSTLGEADSGRKTKTRKTHTERIECRDAYWMVISSRSYGLQSVYPSGNV